MGRIPVKKILKELGKLKEYDYPTEQSSVFLLPNGRFVGKDLIFSHGEMLEKIIGKKLPVREHFRYLVKLQVIRLVVDNSDLYININVKVTKLQKTNLRKIIRSGRYKDYAIDTYGVYTQDYTSKTTHVFLRDIYKILDLKMP